MTRAIVVDDEPLLAQALCDQLRSAWPELEIAAVAHSGGHALELMDRLAPDVAFLDIRMPGLSGLDVARQVAGSQNAPRIVFVTAYDAHAIEAFEARAVDYLLKPVQTGRLQETVARLRDTALPEHEQGLGDQLLDSLRKLVQPEKKQLRWLNCGQGNDIDVISIAEVIYFQSRDKYTAVVTSDRERYIRTALKELVELLDPDEFWQVHRGTVVRAGAIDRVSRDDMGRTVLRVKGRDELVKVSAAFTGRFRQM